MAGPGLVVRTGIDAATLDSLPGAISLYGGVARLRPLPAREIADVQAEASAILDQHESAFHAALERAQARGEIRTDEDLRALARFITASFHGLRL